LGGLNVRSIVPSESDPDRVLVAARARSGRRGGVYVVTNDGRTTQRTLLGDVSHLVGDPGDANVFYAAIPGKGIFRSALAGAEGSWQAVNAGLPFAAATRIELAVHRSATANVVYAAFVSEVANKSKLTSIYRSIDQGQHWTRIGNQPDVTPGGSGYVHMALAADPTKPAVLYVSGDLDTSNNLGNVWRVDVSGAAPVWTQITMANADPDGPTGANPGTAPHPDSRDIVFDANRGLLQSDDGGIYRMRDPDNIGGNTRFWESKNGDLQVSELYSVAYDSINKSLFAGQQDVGVVEQPSPGDKRWRVANGGDGINVQVFNTGSESIHWSSTQNLRDLHYREYLGGTIDPEHPKTLGTPALRIAGTTRSTLTGPGILPNRAGKLVFDNSLGFYSKFVVNAVDPSRILIGTSYLYESTDRGNTLTNLTGVQDFSTDAIDDDHDGTAVGDADEFMPYAGFGTINALLYGGRFNGADKPTILYAAAEKALWVRGDADVRPSPRAFPGGDIRDIAIDRENWKRGVVIDQGRVFVFDNAAAAAGDWREITGKLNAQTGDLRTVEYIPFTDNSVTPAAQRVMVVVGGRRGIYATVVPAAGETPRWTRVGSDLPNVVVNDVRYHRGDDILVAATMGRGAYKMGNFLKSSLPAKVISPLAPGGAGLLAAEPLPSADPGTLEIVGDDAADHNDTIRLALSPTNYDVLDVFVNNTTGVPDYSIDVASLQKIVVTGGDGDDTLIIDQANGLFKIPEGLEFDETGPGTNARREINATPLNDGIVSKIRTGLQAVADFGNRLAEVGELAEQLPGLGITLAQTLGVGDASAPIGGVLKQGFADPVAGYFTGDSTPTLQELVHFLKSLRNPLGNVIFGIDPGSVTAGIHTAADGHQELRVDLKVEIEGFAGEIPLDFAQEVGSLGMTLTGDGKIDLETGMDLTMSFGVDLTPGLSDAQAFFIKVDDLSFDGHARAGIIPGEPEEAESPQGPEAEEEEEADVGEFDNHGPGFNLGLKLGFLDAAIENGAFDLGVEVHVDVNNPDGDADGKITLAELAGTSIGGLVTFEPEGEFEAELPVRVKLAGVTTVTPIIKIHSDALFDQIPEVEVENFDSLLDFKNINTENVLALLRQLVSALNTFRQAEVFDTAIPFTGATLGDVLDFATALDQKVIQPLTGAGGGAGFAGAQQLAETLATALGLDPSFIDAHYDPATHEVKYHVKLGTNLAPRAVPLNFSADLGPLGGVTTTSQLTLDAGLAADFTFGINLSPGPLSPQGRFFIQGATLKGDLSLSAADIDAAARFGFVNVATSDGHGDIDGSVALSLKNPTTAGTRVTMSELADAAANNALGLLQGGAPQVAGSASLELDKIAITPGLPGLTPPADSHVSVTVADLRNPTNAVVEVVGFDGLRNLKDLDFNDITAALDALVAYLSKLEQFGFLDRKLPLVDRSVGDMLHWAQTFTEKLNELKSNPAETLQSVEQAIEQRFGIDPGLVTLSMDGKALKTHLAFKPRFAQDLPFNFDLASIPGLPSELAGVVNLSGSGLVHVDAGMNLNLDLGIDLTDPAAPAPFIYDSTGTTVDARLNAQGLDFGLAIVGLGAKSNNGSVNLHKMGSPNAPATFTASLLHDPADTDGRHYFSELGTLSGSDVGLALDGGSTSTCRSSSRLARPCRRRCRSRSTTSRRCSAATPRSST
jgi:hypothetical protein